MTTTAIEPYSPLQPIPVIKKLTDAGVLTISWDRQMQQPSNLNELPFSKVVITDQSEGDLIEKEKRFKVERGNSRNLRKTREWFLTQKDYHEYLLVMDALDIDLISSDDQQKQTISFTWDLISYEKESMDIQLYFDLP